MDLVQNNLFTFKDSQKMLLLAKQWRVTSEINPIKSGKCARMQKLVAAEILSVGTAEARSRFNWIYELTRDCDSRFSCSSTCARAATLSGSYDWCE